MFLNLPGEPKAAFSIKFPNEILFRFSAILPIGALEWHGNHLPLGTDTVLAERFAQELAYQAGAELLPTLNTPMTTLPHGLSQQISTE
ncbi:creatininase family protein, partial [Acinetobacter baumannii]